ncbi:hypothetical protein [Cohnella sp.]|uniref:hypothetical protein n=1 Tax=Cohnella sp. TaxID=1883426 RepID=UPI00370442B5
MQTKSTLANAVWEMRAGRIGLTIASTEGGWRKTIFARNGPIKLEIDSAREFKLRTGRGAADERIYSDENCRLIEAKTSEGRIELFFREIGDLFEAVVRYEIEQDRYVKKTVELLPLRGSLYLKKLTLESFETARPGERGGEGQPVFVDGHAFLGVEFPVSRNEIAEGCLIFGHAPGIEIPEGREWRSYRMTYGLNEGKGLTEAFLTYIRKHQARRKVEPLAIYCDWGLHDELSDQIELTAEMTDGMLEHLRWMKEIHGIAFDYYLIDAFWFEEGEVYGSFKARTWPSGFGAIRKKMDELGLKLGLWFDLSGNFLRMERLREARIELDKYELCLGHPDYANALKEALLHHVREHGMKMIKLDFAAFSCSNPKHDHLPGEHSKEASISRFVELLREVKEAEPELVVLAYNGFTTNYDWIKDVDGEREGAAVSPWWAFHLDFIYCGDPRPSELPALRLRDSIHSYTDAMIRQFEHSLLPHETMDDHGVMIGDTGTIYRLGKEGWRNDWLLSIARGGRKTHFYGDLRQLNESDYIFLKTTWPLQREAVAKGYSTESVAGNPLQEQAYGYMNANEREGCITLFNPHPIRTAVKLADEIGKRARGGEANVALAKLYAGERWLGSGGARLNPYEPIELEPFEVVMLKWDAAEAPGLSSAEWQVEEVFPFTKMEGTARLRTVVPVSSSPEDRWVVRYRDGAMKPLRTVRGRPDGMRIAVGTGEEKRELIPLYDQDVWSGMSWMVYRTEEEWTPTEEAFLSLEYDGVSVVYVEVQRWSRKPGEAV